MKSMEAKAKVFLGWVMYLNELKGFDFIVSETRGDVFFRKSQCVHGVLCVGDEVAFQVRPSKKGNEKFEAVSLKMANRSKDGEAVFDRNNSHLHSNIIGILSEIIDSVECHGDDFVEQEVTFDRVIGENILVKTDAGDEIVFARRQGRKWHTRFVLDRQPEECQTVTVALKRVESGYIIITAFVGRKAPPEPWAENVNASSMGFWNAHALIYGFETVDEETISKEFPWKEKEPMAERGAAA